MPRSRPSIAVLAVFVWVLVSVHGGAAQEATSPPEDAPVDLSGLWLDSGRVIQVTQTGSEVTAMYIEPHECDHRDGNTSETDFDFNAALDGMSLTGEMSACYWDTSNPAAGGFRNVPLDLTLSVDGNTLEGTWYNSVDDQDEPLTITRIPCRLAVFDGDNFVGDEVVADLEFIPLLKRIDAYAAEHNVRVHVTSSFRNTADVNEPIVDPATVSNHMVGHAIDMNVAYGASGFCNSTCLKGDDLPADVDAFLDAVRNDPDLRYGGDFNTPDVVHIDDGLNVNDRAAWDDIRSEIEADPECYEE